MKQVSNDIYRKLLEIGEMLEISKKDIKALQKLILNSDLTKPEKISVQNPIDSYKEPCGPYYGTVSINDF